jgi:hypothetical protein
MEIKRFFPEFAAVEPLLLNYPQSPDCRQGQCIAKADFIVESNPHLAFCAPHTLEWFIDWLRMPRTRRYKANPALPLEIQKREPVLRSKDVLKALKPQRSTPPKPKPQIVPAKALPELSNVPQLGAGIYCGPCAERGFESIPASHDVAGTKMCNLCFRGERRHA